MLFVLRWMHADFTCEALVHAVKAHCSDVESHLLREFEDISILLVTAYFARYGASKID